MWHFVRLNTIYLYIILKQLPQRKRYAVSLNTIYLYIILKLCRLEIGERGV